MKMPARDILIAKGYEVITIGAADTVFDAIRLMAEKSIGALLVMTKTGKLSGILSERDCFRKVILREKSPHEVHVKDVMTRKVQYVNPDRTVEECMGIMTQNRIRHLPVMEGEKVVGIISIGDCVKFLVSEQDLMIRNLEKYIEGSL